MKKQIGLFTAILFAVSIAMMACKAEVHTHTFAEEWTSDEINHWRAATCEHKDEVIIDRAKHTFGNWTTTKEPTEEAKGSRERTCTVCGYTATESIAKLPHTHKFETEWTSDAENHWYAATCEHTTEVSGKAEHSFDNWTTTKEATEEAEGSKERTCTVCGYTATEAIEKLAHTHKFATEWTKDETNHWHASTCGHEVTEGKTAHTFGDWITTKEPTEEAEGSREKSCTVCGYTATEAIEKLAHTHKFAESLTKDETHHWYTATCEHTTEVSGKAKHTFGDWTTTKEPTEEAEGSKERTCTVCGYTATEVIEKLEHTHKFATDWTKDETNHWYASTCGHEVTEGKTAHTFGDWITTKEATEEAEGSKERTCTVCGYTATEAIEKLAHTHKFATDWTKDETNHWHASTCGHEVTEGKTAHTFADWITTKAATEEETGSKERVCDVCKYIDTEVIAKLEHTHKFATEWTKDETNHWHVSTCGHEVTDSKAAHTFGDWTTTKAATCTEEGNKTRTCEVCKKEVTEKIPAKGHNYSETWTSDAENHWHASTCGHEVTEGKTVHTFGDWTTTKEATCTEEGNKTRTCEVCKKEVTEKIDAKGHSYGEYVSNNDATTEADGTKTRECSVCGYKDTVTDEGSKIIVPEFVFVKGDTVTGAKNTNNYAGVFIEGRTVTLSDFYMGKYEVTQEEYASVMAGQTVTVNGTEYALESNPSYCTADSTGYTLFSGDVQEKRPVEGVTWYDAVWYCNALSEKEGLTKAYNIEVTEVKQASSGKTGYYIYEANVTLNENANGYRLPTEAEWEYAARGGDPTKDDWNYVFSGADTAEGVSYTSRKNSGLDSVGWYCYNNITGITGDSDVTNNVSGKGTHQVGKKKANRLGLYDMSGNVREWCYDGYETVNTGEESDPTGATSGSSRVHRGGCWYYGASDASVSCRSSDDPDYRNRSFGFRVVRASSK